MVEPAIPVDCNSTQAPPPPTRSSMGNIEFRSILLESMQSTSPASGENLDLAEGSTAIQTSANRAKEE